MVTQNESLLEGVPCPLFSAPFNVSQCYFLIVLVLNFPTLTFPIYVVRMIVKAQFMEVTSLLLTYKIKDTSYAWAKNGHLLEVLLHDSVYKWSIKNLNAIFWQRIRRWGKLGQSWKATSSMSSVRAKIENVKKLQTFGYSISVPPPEECYWVCESYIVHHLNSTGLCWSTM